MDNQSITPKETPFREVENFAQIAGSLSHRIGNKCGAIRALTNELFEYLSDSGNVDDRIVYLVDAIDRCNRYVLNMADLIYKPYGAIVEGISSICIEESLSDALLLVEIPNDISIINQFAKNIPLVWGNRYLTDVFFELFCIALDLLSQCPDKRLTIKTQLNNNFVEIIIKIAGSVIIPEESRIFDFMYISDVKPSQDRQHRYGLWWTKVFLNSFGGSIKLHSDPDNCSFFAVELPVTQLKKC